MKLNLVTQIIVTSILIHLSYSTYFQSPLNLYVADNNSSTIFRKQSQKGNIIGVLFTNKYCQQCYHQERELIELISTLYQKTKIQIYRSELSLNPNLQEQFNIKRFPMLHFVTPQHNSYHLYLNHKIVTLSSTLPIVQKLKYYLNYQEKTSFTSNAIAVNIEQLVFTDQKEMVSLYGLNYKYQEAPLMLFQRQKQFKNTLEQYKVPLSQVNTCLIYHLSDNLCYQPKSLEELQFILSLSSFKQIVEFTESAYTFYKSLELTRYVFVAVLDSIFHRQQSLKYIEMLKKIINREQLLEKVTIFWMQTQINKQKLQHLGFKKNDKPPLLAYLDLDNPKKLTFGNQPEQHFDEQSVLNFITHILKIDEQIQLQEQNYELLEESLRRLGLNKKIQVVKQHITDSLIQYSFVLSLPKIDYDSINSKQIFYRPLLNFNYLVQRIQRFSSIKLHKKVTLQQLFCDKSSSHGLFLFHQQHCLEIISQPTFEKSNFIPEIIEMLQKIFELPKFFWVNEDNYEEFLTSKEQLPNKPQFTYEFIQI